MDAKVNFRGEYWYSAPRSASKAQAGELMHFFYYAIFQERERETWPTVVRNRLGKFFFFLHCYSNEGPHKIRREEEEGATHFFFGHLVRAPKGSTCLCICILFIYIDRFFLDRKPFSFFFGPIHLLSFQRFLPWAIFFLLLAFLFTTCESDRKTPLFQGV